MEKRWCNACGGAFEPRPQAPRQAYCSKPQCQTARKLLWQRAKRGTDADYHQNQVEAQKTWRSKNRGYWKSYREAHPEYTDKNRAQQRRRNERRVHDPSTIAKGDASLPWPLAAGVFNLIEIGPAEQPIPRTWTVLLLLITTTPL